MRRIMFALLATSLALVLVPTHAAQPSGGAVSLARPTVRWGGGPMTGDGITGQLIEVGQDLGADLCNPDACDDFKLTISVPQSYWKRVFGGVAIAAEWDGADNDFDLFVLNSAGEVIARSTQEGSASEVVALVAPRPGSYTVRVVAFSVSNARYRARASIVQERGSKG